MEESKDTDVSLETAKNHDLSLEASKAVYTNKTPVGLRKDHQLSDRRSKVYLDEDENVYIAYRGTRINNVNDLKADYHIVKGTEEDSERFQEAEKKYNRVVEKYGKERIYLTGHSLGGNQARYVGHRNKVDSVITYNAFVNPVSEFSRRNDESLSQVYNYRTNFDPASIGLFLSNESLTNIQGNRYDSHTIHNFEITNSPNDVVLLSYDEKPELLSITGGSTRDLTINNSTKKKHRRKYYINKQGKRVYVS